MLKRWITEVEFHLCILQHHTKYAITQSTPSHKTPSHKAHHHTKHTITQSIPSHKSHHHTMHTITQSKPSHKTPSHKAHHHTMHTITQGTPSHKAHHHTKHTITQCTPSPTHVYLEHHSRKEDLSYHVLGNIKGLSQKFACRGSLMWKDGYPRKNHRCCLPFLE